MPDDPKLDSERLRGRVEQWKQVISVQMHFNDMCIRIRWLSLTVVATLLAAAALSEKDNVRVSLPIERLPVVGLASVILIISLMTVVSLFLLDFFSYYKMLLASVAYGIQLEAQLSDDLRIGEGNITSRIAQGVTRRRSTTVTSVFYGILLFVVVGFLIGSFFPRVV